MKYGVTMFVTDYSIAPAALASACEERGFESLWVPEHSHIPSSRRSPWPGGAELPKMYYDAMDPFVSLASAASVTTTLGLATGICLVVQRDPLQLAKVVASLDQISGGRFLFGIGAGWNAEEMADHGTAFETRARLMRERIEAMKRIWSQDEPEYHGEFVSFDKMRTSPKPAQKPHPPIHVGGAWPYGARRAVRYGDGWMPIHGRGEDTVERLPDLEKLLVEAARPPDALELTIFGVPPDASELRRYADAGIERVVFGLPSADAEAVLPLLDRQATLAHSIG